MKTKRNSIFGALIALSIIASANIAVTVRAIPVPGSLWYNGDFDGSRTLANVRNGLAAQSSVYDNFIVPVADASWLVTSIYSNNLMSGFAVTGADWSIRSGVSAGNGGIIIASGTLSPATVTPTGTTFLGSYTEFTIQVSGLNILLLPGTYWLNVTPVDSGSGQSYNSGTIGANAVGMPPGNDGNAFWDSTTYGTNFSPAEGDFSMGVIGKIPVVSGVPETGSTAAMMGLSTILLLGVARLRRASAFAKVTAR
jgi:hypothetical protein